MWKPDYYRNSVSTGDQRFFRTSGEEYLYGLPLFVLDSGLSRWIPGLFCHRRKSRLFSVELITSGNARFIQNERSHTVEPGEVFLVHKDQDQRFEPGPAGYLHKRMVIMDGIMLDMMLHSLGLHNRDVIRIPDPMILIRLIKRINCVIGTGSADTPWLLSQLAYQVLLELGKAAAHTRVPDEVARALRYMDANLQKNLTLSEVAIETGISMYHFSRVFQKSMNCPPISFFIRQKMEYAKTLLANTSMLIKEIATILGYEDPFYFTAQFRKHTGFPPRTFRNNSGPANDHRRQ